ncbi:MAG: winged helix-turn-helix transcriptional regulator [Muribaculaceae bacterium]|nr:winged helix-turn-helix transcriptional regulator [Muribaculaceae bacterium]
MPDMSARMLSATLNTLVADGLEERYSYNIVPPTVEYSLIAQRVSSALRALDTAR